jgi:hypothetical protein
MRENHIKRGTIREDGKVFWCYDERSKNPEVWIDKDVYKNRHEKDKIRSKKWNADNLDKFKSNSKRWNQRNRERCREYCKKWRSKNKKRKREYESQLKKLSTLYGITQSIRALVLTKFREGGYTKKSKVYEIIGCSYDDFKKHIESQFQEGMSWQNHNRYGWHLDHIIPCASAKTEEELIKLNHYTNYQPLWAKDNMTKGSKIL